MDEPSPYNDDSMLVCRYCKSEYIGHFSRVQFFARDSEDSEATIVEYARRETGRGFKIYRGPAPNRRDTIRVWAHCEECDRDTIFELEEHKGYLLFDLVQPSH